MVKEILRQHFEVISKLGMFSIEQVSIPQKSGAPIIVTKPIRTARDQMILDRYGQPDDQACAILVRQESVHRLKQIYSILKTELIVRKRNELLIHRLKEEELLKDNYELFNYCYQVSRLLELFVPHDRNYLSTIVNQDGIEIGDKVVPEHLADKPLENMEDDHNKAKEDEKTENERLDNEVDEEVNKVNVIKEEINKVNEVKKDV